MLTLAEIMETIKMVQEENLDIRTVTMGINLLDCADHDPAIAQQKIYHKITSRAKNIVTVGNDLAREYGIPIVNKRIAVTPISLVAGCSPEADYTDFALCLDKAA
ncbi:MAG TPA: PFL family protein, partial [Desulfotomaculum sp.]|nr:PFL family protein [Desulfotomaculum sp.]HCJ79189.1 PFL family protein [Desulfotomaculum sp.]